MAQFIEVKVRYDRTKVVGSSIIKKVSEVYLVNALSCTEAEVVVTKELKPYVNGDFNITSVNKTKINEVHLSLPTIEDCSLYKVKANFETIDEKSGMSKNTANYFLVEAVDFDDAFKTFKHIMQGSISDFEVESISETKYVDVFTSNLSTAK